MAEYKGKFTGEQTDERLSLAEQVPNKADKNGKYPNMTVGFAENLIGRGDTQEAYINFRPSAGADTNITDGAARIKKIKGNSLVWNQAVSNADFRNGIAGWGSSLADIYARDGYMEFVINEQGSQQFSHYFATPLAKGHKYAIVCDFKRNTTAEFPLYIYFGKQSGGYDTFYSDSYSSETRHISTAFITTTDAIDFMLVYPFINAEVGTSAYIYSVRVVDLTKMFTAGNEPTTILEYYERKPMNISDECEYSDGVIVDMKINSLVSVGDNLFDKSLWQRGAMSLDGIFTPDNNCPYGSVLLKCIPNTTYYGVDFSNGFVTAPFWFYDEQMNFIKYDYVGTTGDMNIHNAKGLISSPDNAHYVRIVCYEEYLDTCSISLVHSGYKAENHKYVPYQQDVKDLSFISEVFPNGMRSVGNVCDEFRFNQTKKVWEKVTRIGVIPDLSSLIVRQTNANGEFVLNLPQNYIGVKDYNSISPILSSVFVATSVYAADTYGISDCIYGQDDWLIMRSSKHNDLTSIKAAMLGVPMYYKLAEPIITLIEGSENRNLDYLVWDFGTEEAIASVPSAPFRADINYEFNAVDDIRWAHSKIKELLADIELLKASQTSSTLVE